MQKRTRRKVIIAISCVAFIALAVLAILLFLRNGTNPFERAMRKSLWIEGLSSTESLDDNLEAELNGKPAGTALDWVNRFNFPHLYSPLNYIHNPESVKMPFFRKCGDYQLRINKSADFVKGSLYYCVFGTALSSGEKVYVYQFFRQLAFNKPDRSYTNEEWEHIEQFGTTLYYFKPYDAENYIGYPRLYSVKGLSYADFADIGPGSTLEDVMAVDPVAEIHRYEEERDLKDRSGERKNKEKREENIERFYTTPFFKLHLVDEGILCIYYKHTRGEQINPVVIGMKLYRDCRIGELKQALPTDIGYCIDPADRPPRVDPPPMGEAPPDIVGEIE